MSDAAAQTDPYPALAALDTLDGQVCEFSAALGRLGDILQYALEELGSAPLALEMHRWVTREEAAAHLGLSSFHITACMAGRRYNGFPAYGNGRSVRVHIPDAVAWIISNKRAILRTLGAARGQPGGLKLSKRKQTTLKNWYEDPPPHDYRHYY